MKLSVSNIAWKQPQDEDVYERMRALGIYGLEIAPTRIFPERPYEHLSAAHAWSNRMRQKYGYSISSMQSIWYGMTQRIAGSAEERETLYQYTAGAIHFAAACGCRSLVFGCPGNRTVGGAEDITVNEIFLLKIAQVAQENGVVIALEANPPIYHTNYINTTEQAVQTLRKLNHPALGLNFDFGTAVANGEDIRVLEPHIDLISHVHISEPGLKPLQKREGHRLLRSMLENGGYEHFVSLEMGAPSDPEALYTSMDYLKEVFG